jgi:hypothetical protein
MLFSSDAEPVLLPRSSPSSTTQEDKKLLISETNKADGSPFPSVVSKGGPLRGYWPFVNGIDGSTICGPFSKG